MYNRKIIIIFFFMICFLFSFSAFSISIGMENANSAHYTDKLSVVSNNSLHNPINITGNTELATMSTSGNGSVTNPYIIENIVINNCATSGTGVNIRNTDKYFVLRNISVSNCSIGFSFSNVTFSSITNSYATYNSVGFLLNISSNDVLMNNIAANNGDGFELFSSFNNTITDNLALSNQEYGYGGSGFGLNSSSDNILANNNASGNTLNGFFLGSSPNNTLINNTGTYNYFGFNLENFSPNSTLKNNTATNNAVGFKIGTNNTLLVNNIAINNSGQGFYIFLSFNNRIISNIAIDNYFGFDLEFSSVNLLKNNIGNYNTHGDYSETNSYFNILINNKFIFINNELTNSFSTTLFSYDNIIGVIILLSIYSILGYMYFTTNTRKEKIKLLEKSSNGSWYLGLVSSLLVIISVLLPYIETIFNRYNSVYSYYNFQFSVNSYIFQLSIFSGLLLLGGAGATIVSFFIHRYAKFFDEYKIAEQMSLIGAITQVIGFILILLAYNDIINDINAINVSGLSRYAVNPSAGLFLSLIGIILAVIAYYYHRKGNKEYLALYPYDSIK